MCKFRVIRDRNIHPTFSLSPKLPKICILKKIENLPLDCYFVEQTILSALDFGNFFQLDLRIKESFRKLENIRF